jgi:hypothetical protein
MCFSVRHAAVLVLLLASVARAAETETQYLSGLGKDDPVQWQFMCDKGQNANKWSTIGVPSNWQLQGFGIYEYGRPVPATGWPRTHGIYKRTFTTPSTWRDKTAVSTGRCNAGLKFTSWSIEAQSLPWTLIEAQGYLVEVGLGVAG